MEVMALRRPTGSATFGAYEMGCVQNFSVDHIEHFRIDLGIELARKQFRRVTQGFKIALVQNSWIGRVRAVPIRKCQIFRGEIVPKRRIGNDGLKKDLIRNKHKSEVSCELRVRLNEPIHILDTRSSQCPPLGTTARLEPERKSAANVYGKAPATKLKVPVLDPIHWSIVAPMIRPPISGRERKRLHKFSPPIPP